MNLIGCVATWNEAPLIGGALDSLKSVGCDWVLVVDGAWDNFHGDGDYLSSDGTRGIARERGAIVIEPPGRPWVDEVEARSRYLAGDPGDWYLVVDADERVHGTLPDLTSDINAYLVEIEGQERFSRMRLFRHSGRQLIYRNQHYSVYADGKLLTATSLANGLWIEHLERNDPARAAAKAVWAPAQIEREQRRPVLKMIPKNPLGPLTYVGPGWIPGVPKRNLTADEADLYHGALVENLASARPIYVIATLPAETPATDKRRKSRQEEEK